MKNRGKSLAFVGLTQIVWPTSAAVPLLLLDKFSNTQLIFFNSLAGLLIIIPFLIVRKKIDIVKSIIQKPYDVARLMLMGFIGITLYLSCLYQAYNFLSAQLAYSVNLLWPVMTVIFTVLIIKDKFLTRQFLGILIAFIGVVIVISKGDLQSFKVTNWNGVIFSLFAAISYGLYSTLGKKWNYDREASLLFFYFSSALISSIVLIFIPGGYDIPVILFSDIIGFIWIGGFVLALGDLFWFMALKYGNTAELSSIALFGPFIGFFWIYVLLAEPIVPFSIIGMLIVLIGTYLSRYNEDIEP